LPPQPQNSGIIGRSFDAVIRAVIFIGSVTVVLTICFVVLALVADEIGKREPIMNSHVVDAGARAATVVMKKIGRAGHAAAKLADEIAFPGPVATQRAAKAVVPLRPARRKRTDPIAAGTKIPRLGDQFGARQDRVLPDGRKEGHATIK